jgi:prepilin-type N-terminal cleavage/methylation domain-containing protein
MAYKKRGFTLVEVLVAIVIFAFGVLSMAAFASLNYSYLRVNQARAKLHVLNESIIDNLQEWSRKDADFNGPSKFDSLWFADPESTILHTYMPEGSLLIAEVVYDSNSGASPAASDAKIFLTINSTARTGNRVINEIARFALANYGMGE